MKKILIVTYYWPPAGGPGVQRWLNFVKYLPENNIEPLLYIPSNPHYPITDQSLVNSVPGDLTIYKRPIWEPYKWASKISRKKTRKISSGIVPSADPTWTERILLWIRGNLFIPDARKYWITPSIRFLTGILKKEGVEAVITTGPPHSLHLIGLGLKKDLNIKWIADFRDPWTSIGYHQALRLTGSSQKKHMALEKQVLTSADEILVTSQTTKKEFKKLTDKPITVITNGYESMENSQIKPDTYFTISHIGSLLSERNPVILWEVLSELATEKPEFRKAFRLQLIGTVSDEIIQTIRGLGLAEQLHLSPYVAHEEAVKIQHRSWILLMIEINAERTKGIIPGKLFEYMAARRPILAIGPEDWEAGTLVNDTASGQVFTYTMKNELKKTIWKWFGAYQAGKLEIPSRNIEQYSRRALTKKLAGRIHGNSL